MNKIQDLVTLCQGHLVYIQTHNFPDPDAIASAYGLQKAAGDLWRGVKALLRWKD